MKGDWKEEEGERSLEDGLGRRLGCETARCCHLQYKLSESPTNIRNILCPQIQSCKDEHHVVSAAQYGSCGTAYKLVKAVMA